MNFENTEVLATPVRLQSLNAEKSVLSVLINNPDAMDSIGETLKPEHFSIDYHRSLYAEVQRQLADGKGCDIATLAEAMDGVMSYTEIMEVALSNEFGSRALSKHVSTIIDRYKSRQLHGLSSLIGELAFGDTPVQERIDQAQAALIKLGDTDVSDDWIDAHRAAIEHLTLLEQREAGTVKGMATGLADFDELLDGGMHRGNLVVIGARPAMGKTALGMTIGLHMAQTYSVGMLSMEMPHNDVRDRQAAILGRVSMGNIKRPSRGLEYDRIVEAVERAKVLRFNVSDKSGLTILQVRSKARALKRKHSLDVLIVDYIGLMNGVDPKQPRAYQIEEISRGLKGLAKELGIVVVCLAQVNRGATERANQVPGLQDLRDSGAIEQDADVVGFIHRPIAANPDAGEQFLNYGLLRVAKNRQGRTGDVHLAYMGEHTMFASWSGQPPSAGASKSSRGM